MTKILDTKIDQVKENIIEIGVLSRNMLKDSVLALYEMDKDRAEEVISRRKELTRIKKEIETKLIRALSLYQPMASDLRTILCMEQMANSFYRIGRNGKEISYIVSEMLDEDHLDEVESICSMAEEVDAMINDVIEAFKSDDTTVFENFHNRDDKIDKLYRTIYSKSVTHISEDLRHASHCLEYVLAARFLERCGDHACLMGEKIIYMLSGEHTDLN